MTNYLVSPGEVAWQENTPVSQEYGDIYWQPDNALAEKHNVFVAPLKALVGQGQKRTQVTVCEFGFGFGLNCLLTAAAWQEMPDTCMLNLVSIEKHPVSLDNLDRFLSDHSFPHQAELLTQYPPPYRGQHVIWLARNIRLLLIFEDIADALGNLDARVDCWFLDGFAPSKNSAMWDAKLYGMMFARSCTGAVVTTYSAAGHVRRSLTAAGFETSLVPGHGAKREMLRAYRPGRWQAAPHGRESVTIVGAGMAGCFCAEALTRRGLPAQLLDNGQPGASQLPQLTVLPQLAVAGEARYRLSLCASQYMVSAAGFNQSGVCWIGRTEEESERLHKISAMFPDTMIERLRDDSVLFRRAGWFELGTLKSALAHTQLAFHAETLRAIDNGWQCTNASLEAIETNHVILTTGADRSLLPSTLQIRTIGGQAISIPTTHQGAVINGKVTVFPAVEGKSVVSGTYERGSEIEPTAEASRYLRQTAGEFVDIDVDALEPRTVPWTGVRAVSRDRLPIIGPAPAWDSLSEINRVSAARQIQPGLHYCSAFGSRGATHARLFAEQVVSKLLNEPSAIGLAEQRLLSPARFVIRDQNAQGQSR